MRKSLTALLAVAAFAAAAGSASAGAPAGTLNATFNFDSQSSGSLASLFNTPQVTFHNAKFAPTLDGLGDPIAGTDHWQIDATSDTAFPLLVENPSLYGRGSAPSGTNAINGLDQEILVQFDRAYDLSSFSVTLDNDTFGLSSAQINFINGSSTLLSVNADQSVAGLVVSHGAVSGVTGIVLPALGFYDNISVAGASAVPEPSTWAGFAGVAALGLAIVRRRRAVATV
jgi:hypothetical protein